MAGKYDGVLKTRQEMPPEPEAHDTRRPSGRPGRPENGKRSDPEYAQVSAWIKKDTHRRAKIKMLQRGDDRDFSDLLQELLESWIGTP